MREFFSESVDNKDWLPVFVSALIKGTEDGKIK